ncbi:MAG: di-heme oxidoredictase family protein [Pseudomonadota bacterium]
MALSFAAKPISTPQGQPVKTAALLALPEVRDDLTAADLARVRAVTSPPENFSKAEPFEARMGGAGTSGKRVNRDAFSHNSQNLSFEQEQDFKLGNALFRKLWVSSPASTHASDGLGPLFNARACQSCHLKDGRGHPPEGDADATSMLMRLARPARTQAEIAALQNYLFAAIPDDIYGGQLQDLAVPGLAAEGEFAIAYEEFEVELAGGEVASLRKPTYSLNELAYGPLDPDVTLSPRIANPMIGLGLVEAIHPSDIAALADPEDADGDGISGRMNVALNPLTGELQLGRFGWKASMPTIEVQSADAFFGDIGISTDIRLAAAGDCTTAQTECLAMPDGVQKRLGESEAPPNVLSLVAFYSANLAVPARRNVGGTTALRGKELFFETGCARCHTPKFVTSRDATRQEHRFQLIWPHSDFLLHDMGEGLADGQAVAAASGREWRTPPLWGIGLTETVNGHTFFLHDGRARNLTEAVLWHGGEGQASRDRFAGLKKSDRHALIAYLESL